MITLCEDMGEAGVSLNEGNKSGSFVRTKSKVFPALWVGSLINWKWKCWEQNSDNRFIIFLSSAGAPTSGEQAGKLVWGRLKSPAIRIFGVGTSSSPIIADRFCRSVSNCGDTEIFPPTGSFGCLYTVHMIRFMEGILMQIASITPQECSSRISGELAILFLT